MTTLACLGAVAASRSPWSLLDTATIVKAGLRGAPYVVQMTSQVDPTQYYGVTGGEVLYTPDSLYFQDIYRLSTDWQAVTPWGGGSPRFALAIDMNGDDAFTPGVNGDGWAFVYVLVQFPYFYGGSTGWLHTGNLIGSTAGIFDTTQFGGPSGYTNYAGALSLLSGKRVMSIMLVTDGGWFTSSYYGVKQQVVWANNITVNRAVYTATAPKQPRR